MSIRKFKLSGVLCVAAALSACSQSKSADPVAAAALSSVPPSFDVRISFKPNESFESLSDPLNGAPVFSFALCLDRVVFVGRTVNQEPSSPESHVDAKLSSKVRSTWDAAGSDLTTANVVAGDYGQVQLYLNRACEGWANSFQILNSQIQYSSDSEVVLSFSGAIEIVENSHVMISNKSLISSVYGAQNPTAINALMSQHHASGVAEMGE